MAKPDLKGPLYSSNLFTGFRGRYHIKFYCVFEYHALSIYLEVHCVTLFASDRICVFVSDSHGFGSVVAQEVRVNLNTLTTAKVIEDFQNSTPRRSIINNYAVH